MFSFVLFRVTSCRFVDRRMFLIEATDVSTDCQSPKISRGLKDEDVSFLERIPNCHCSASPNNDSSGPGLAAVAWTQSRWRRPWRECRLAQRVERGMEGDSRHWSLFAACGHRPDLCFRQARRSRDFAFP